MNELTRQVVAKYTANGLSGMTKPEVHLLLSAKQLHLADVSQRCCDGQGLHVNLPLKRILEKDVREIGKTYQQLLQEHSKAGKEEREIER
jgi:hypothetical protein